MFFLTFPARPVIINLNSIPDPKGSSPAWKVRHIVCFAVPFLGRGFSYVNKRRYKMETRVAVMSIIVEDSDTVEKLNGILH